MSNLHRLSWIDGQIRAKRYPNCVRIAEQFSLSPRQAARDVEYLRDTMGAPIAYCPVRKGYYYAHDTFVLGHVVMTDEQRRGLQYLADRYAKLESEHARHLARLFRRLVDNGEAGETAIALPLFPVDPAELNRFDLLNKAIEKRAKATIAYVDGAGETVRMLLSPYKLYAFHGENFVVGYCEPGGQIRFFALNGLTAVEVTDSGYDLTPLLKQAEIVPELANGANIAYVHLDAPSYAGTFPFRFEPVGGGLFRVEYYDPLRLLAALFASPAGAAVDSPKWLRNLYFNQLDKKLRRMEEHDRLCPAPRIKLDAYRADKPETITAEGRA